MFPHASKLKTHIERRHNEYNLQAYRCHLCQSNFATSNELNSHFDENHEISRNFTLIQDGLDSVYRQFSCTINSESTPDIILEEVNL